LAPFGAERISGFCGIVSGFAFGELENLVACGVFHDLACLVRHFGGFCDLIGLFIGVGAGIFIGTLKGCYLGFSEGGFSGLFDGGFIRLDDASVFCGSSSKFCVRSYFFGARSDFEIIGADGLGGGGCR